MLTGPCRENLNVAECELAPPRCRTHYRRIRRSALPPRQCRAVACRAELKIRIGREVLQHRKSGGQPADAWGWMPLSGRDPRATLLVGRKRTA